MMMMIIAYNDCNIALMMAIDYDRKWIWWLIPLLKNSNDVSSVDNTITTIINANTTGSTSIMIRIKEI